jgi:hypothetical protein
MNRLHALDSQKIDPGSAKEASERKAFDAPHEYHCDHGLLLVAMDPVARNPSPKPHGSY